MDRYDEDCIPANSTTKRVAYIKSIETNKTCTRNLIVSPDTFLLLCLLNYTFIY